MPRTKTFRDLEPLSQGPSLKIIHDKTSSLLDVLRSLAIKNQREQPRVFYSLREVAKKFRFPVSTVAKVYHNLEQEGLVSRVRGSKTVLNGLRYNPRRVRAVVALPALLTTFITLPHYRSFFICLRRELWLRGFATTMVFFRPDEAADGSITDQLRSYEVDTVIWLHPGRATKETLLRLSDMGIRVISVSEVGTPGMPSSRYYVWRERAIESLLRNWRDQNSVRRITVVDSKEYQQPVNEWVLRLLLINLGIEFDTQTFKGEKSHDFLHNLSRVKTGGIIFPSSLLASLFSFRSPEQLVDLLIAQRVALIDGPIDIPFARVPDVQLDLVTLNWQAVAESIVNDLITLDAFDRTRHTTFEGEPQLRIPLSSLSTVGGREDRGL